MPSCTLLSWYQNFLRTHFVRHQRWSYFGPEDGNTKFLRNSDIIIQDYTVLTERLQSECSEPWKQHNKIFCSARNWNYCNNTINYSVRQGIEIIALNSNPEYEIDFFFLRSKRSLTIMTSFTIPSIRHSHNEQINKSFRGNPDRMHHLNVLTRPNTCCSEGAATIEAIDM